MHSDMGRTKFHLSISNISGISLSGYVINSAADAEYQQSASAAE